MYMFYVLIITHLYSNISQASDIFVQNLFVDNYSYLQTTLSTTVSANPDSISILYAFSGASLDFHIVFHCEGGGLKSLVKRLVGGSLKGIVHNFFIFGQDSYFG